MDNDYLWDGSGTPDPEIRQLETLLGRLRYRTVDVRVTRWRSPKVLVPLALAATLVIAFGIARKTDHAPVAGWSYKVLAGTPKIEGVAASSAGFIDPGVSLETDDVARILLSSAEIGEVEVEPNTRMVFVRDDGANASGHFRLIRGTVNALVADARGEFAIETPTATAVDTDGDYVLTVDDSGGSTLCVSNGWVTFASANRESIVPAGAVCETRPGLGPGTPRCENGPDNFRIALDRYDFISHGDEALAGVLHESGPCDLLPLWHILRRVDSSDRARVYDRMTKFAPPPDGVTRDGILSLDHDMMQFWWSQIWNNSSCLLCSDEGYIAPSS